MTPSESLRFDKMYGVIIFDGKDWKFIAFPDKECPVREMVNASRWTLIEAVADLIRGYR